MDLARRGTYGVVRSVDAYKEGNTHIDFDA
jgi:hypothetical protein